MEVAVDSKPAGKTGECDTRLLELGNSVLKISLEISFQELLQNVEAKSGIADFDFEEQLRGGQLVEEVHGSGGFRGAEELEIVFDLLLLLLESFESAVLNGNGGDKLLLEDAGVANDVTFVPLAFAIARVRLNEGRTNRGGSFGRAIES
jgi:hypothetical protein